jgi:hypothetical protein
MPATPIRLVFIMYITSQINPSFYNSDSSAFNVPILAYELNFRTALITTANHHPLFST